MYCSKCGKENSNSDNYCSYCGEKLKKNEIQQATNDERNEKIGKLEIKQNTSGNVLYVLGALVFVIACFWIVFMNYRTFIDISPLKSEFIFYGLKLISLIGILFFGYICIYFIKRGSEEKPLVMVNKDGITDNSTATAIGFIPWENIGNIYIKSTLGYKFIHVNLKNKIKNREYIDITLNSTGIDPVNFLQQILEYRKLIER